MPAKPGLETLSSGEGSPSATGSDGSGKLSTRPISNVFADVHVSLGELLGTATLVKGCGTGTDFLVLVDSAGDTQLDALTVQALCERRFGVGADGLIRATKPDALSGRWFLEQWMADGAAVGVCADGLRVSAHALRFLGFASVEDGASITIESRAGGWRVTRRGELYTVDMGQWQLPAGEDAVARGSDAVVTTSGLAGGRAALRVDIGGSHTVVALAGEDELLRLRLLDAPLVDPAPPAGASVEYVVPLGEEEVAGVLVGTARVRIYQMGEGETRGGGAGSCATAIALNTWGGADAPQVWRLLLAGGEESVRIAGRRVEVTGPARLVARIEAP